MDTIQEGWGTCQQCGKGYHVRKIKYPFKDDSHSVYCPSCGAIVGRVPKGTDDYDVISEEEIRKREREEMAKPNCPICGEKMDIKQGYSKFWGCRNWPECKGTRQIGEED